MILFYRKTPFPISVARELVAHFLGQPAGARSQTHQTPADSSGGQNSSGWLARCHESPRHGKLEKSEYLRFVLEWQLLDRLGELQPGNAPEKGVEDQPHFHPGQARPDALVRAV